MSQCPFKPQHVRNAHNLTEHELRSWRQLLPPFSEQILVKGKDPGFSYGDLLAFGVFAVLIKRMGLNPVVLASVSESIVEHCNKTLWEQLGHEYLCLDLNLESGIVENLRFTNQPDANVNQVVLSAFLILPLQCSLTQVTIFLEQQGFQPYRQQLNLGYPPSMVKNQ